MQIVNYIHFKFTRYIQLITLLLCKDKKCEKSILPAIFICILHASKSM